MKKITKSQKIAIGMILDPNGADEKKIAYIKEHRWSTWLTVAIIKVALLAALLKESRLKDYRDELKELNLIYSDFIKDAEKYLEEA